MQGAATQATREPDERLDQADRHGQAEAGDQRLWKILGQRTKRKAWGFVTVGEDGKQIRVFRSDWSKEWPNPDLPKRKVFPGVTLDALNALGARVRYAEKDGYPPLVLEPAQHVGQAIGQMVFGRAISAHDRAPRLR